MTLDSLPPLADLRVLDASRVLAGPFCGQLLGDLGADVIKIEHPRGGDETRGWGPPFVGALSAYFLACNRNKRAVTLDLAQPAGRTLLHRLVECSDVLIENFRADSADALGLTPAALHERNPRLIVCSISGFGRAGPHRARPGYDFAIQGLSGLMSVTGAVDGPPAKVGVAITDVVTGLYAASALLAALHARQRSGHGYALDIALLDCAVAAQVNLAQAFLSSGDVPPRQGNAHLQIVPYQAFRTADDWLIVAVGNDAQWQHFCRAVERDDWADEPRYRTNVQRVEQRATLVPRIEAVLRERGRAEWERRFGAAGVPHAPVWDYATLFAEPGLSGHGLKVTAHDAAGRPVDLLACPVRLPGMPTPTVPPQLGEHTVEVLQSLLGLDAEAIAELRRREVI